MIKLDVQGHYEGKFPAYIDSDRKNKDKLWCFLNCYVIIANTETF